MTTVQECLQEVIAQGPGYVIHSLGEEGPARTTDWDPSALLADIQLESPRLLEDHAWTEWTTLADGSQTCAIVYGIQGSPPGDRAILGYGSLRAFEAWHRGQNRDNGARPLGAEEMSLSDMKPICAEN